MPTPPPGFELVDEGSTPKPPPGFELVGSSKTPTPPPGFELQDEKPTVNLFSIEGLKSIGHSIIPATQSAYHGYQLLGLEEMQNARDMARKRGENIPIDEEEIQRLNDIQMRKDAIARSNKELQAATPGKPSYPLQIMQGAVQSVAQNAPGIAAGVAAAPVLGPAAMIPGLMAADALQSGSTYSKDRVPTEPGKAPAPIDEAIINAKVQGLAEAGFEILPTGKLLEEVGKTGLTELIKRYALREWTTEIPTTIAQNLSDWSTVEKDMPLGEFLSKLKSDVIDTALTVPLTVGMGGAVAKAQHAAGLAIKPAGPQEMGPSGEMLPIDDARIARRNRLADALNTAETPSLDQNQLPAVPKARVDQPTPTASPGPEVELLMQQIDDMLASNKISDAQLEADKNTVREHEKARATAAPNPATMQQLDGLNDLSRAELGESQKVAANANNYANENDLSERTERPILYGPEGSTGLLLGEAELQPGVYTVGVPTLDRGEGILKAYHDLLSDWTAKYLPGKTVLLMNESAPTDSATGWHAQLPSGVHVITPAVLRSFSQSETYNTNAQAKAFYNLAHEFGHALIADRFFEGTTPDAAVRVRAEANKGVVTEAAIAQLPELQQNVIREFNRIKQSVLDGSMTVQEFIQTWMNPAKNHKYSLASEHYVPGTAPATQLVDAIIRRAFKRNQTLKPNELAALRNEFLGLDEYLAEQTSRYAYQREWDRNAPQSTQSLIGRALQSVRNSLADFFKQLKKNGVLAPGTKFSEWLDSLTKDPVKAVKPGKPKAKKEAEGVGFKEAFDSLKGGGVSEDFYKKAFTAYKAGRTKVAGIEEKLLVEAKAAGKTFADWKELKAYYEERLKPVDTSVTDRIKAARTKKPKVEKVDHNEESKSDTANSYATLEMLVTMGHVKEGSKLYEELNGLIEAGQIEEFIDRVQPLIEKNVKLELSEEDELKIPDVGVNFLDDVKYFYHAVRNEQDISSIFTRGLSPRSNISKLHGQAFEDEGGTVLVFARDDYKTENKSYQNDELVTSGRAKPVAIFKDISTEWKPATSEEKITALEDKAGAEYEELEQRATVYANTLGMPVEDLWKLIWAKDKAGLESAVRKANAEDRGIAEAALKLEKEQAAVFRELDRLEKLRANQQGVSKESIGARFKGFGVPVFLWDRFAPQKAQMRFELDLDLHAAFPQPTEEEAKTPSVQADAAREWKEKGFRSKYFKAWFGNWEIGEGSKVLNANGEPLKLYHSTVNDFSRFEIGDLGFHFGTVRAATIRALQAFYQSMALPTYSDEDLALEIKEKGEWLQEGEATQPTWMILPVVLNLRNPLNIGIENTKWWMRPEYFVGMMLDKGLISITDAKKIADELKQFEPINRPADKRFVTQHERFGPVRDYLKSKGFDGIVYDNVAEGDVSYVAFEPNQVKSIVASRTFSKSPDMHFELDFDEARPDGYSAGKFYQLFGKILGGDRSLLRRSLRHITNLQYKLLQLQQLAHLNPDNSYLGFMVETELNYERFKSSLQEYANRVVDVWQQMGKHAYNGVEKFLRAEQDSGELWVDLVRENGAWIYRPNKTTWLKLQELGIDPTTPLGDEITKHALDVKNSLLDHVNQAHRVLGYLYAQRYTNEEVRSAKLRQLAVDIQEIRKRPYLPQGRFGKHMLTIERKKADGKGWEVVHRESFEQEEERNKAWEKATARAKSDERVRKHTLNETEYVLMSLPQDFAETAASELSLTDDQLERLLEVMMPIKQERALKAYDLERLKLTGASQDILRSYSSFMWHNSNLLAKMRYRADFNLAIRGVGTMLRRAEYSGQPGSEVLEQKLRHIKQYMERTRDTIMNPAHELHLLRSIVALSYLAFNVKTAAMNIFGLITTWSDMISRFGVVEGYEIMLKASGATLASINPLDLNSRAKWDVMNPVWQQGLDRAIREGQLSQSYAYHLAAVSNASNLNRMPGRNVMRRGFRRALDVGMWLFRLSELSTRRMTFLAQLEGEMRKETKNPERYVGETSTAYDRAIKATNILQNNYSQGNRPPLLRGWKLTSGPKWVEGVPAAMTIFASFMQHMAFHAYGGYELGVRRRQRLAGQATQGVWHGYTMKLALMLLVLAGYEGLPGMENILDLLDFFWKRMTGKPFRENLRTELRDFIHNVTDVETDPLALAHGLGHDVGGFDVSRSIGLGRVVPGTDIVARSGSGDYKSALGQGVLAATGPAGGMADWLLRGAFGKDSAKQFAKRTPGALGNIITAYYWSKEGVRGAHDGLITRDAQTGEIRDLTTTELYGKALGFNPTIVSRNREIIFSQYDAKMYWQGKRTRLFEQMWEASFYKDAEGVADVQKAIRQFNENLPKDYGRLRITPKDLAQSRQKHMQDVRLEEAGLPREKRYRQVYKSTEESFRPSPGASPAGTNLDLDR